MKFEHLVKISRDGEKRKATTQWPVDPSKRSKPLARRRTGSFIKYYDLGRLAAGTDISFVMYPTLSGIESVRSPASTIIGALSSTGGILKIGQAADSKVRVTFSTMDYSADWNTSLLANNLETLADTYHELTLADITEYGLLASATSDYVTGRGFRVPVGEKGGPLIAYGSRYFAPLSTAGDSPDAPIGSIPTHTVSKVTATNDYTSAAVEFTLTGNYDVFLAPKIWLWYGICSGGGATVPDTNPATYDGTPGTDNTEGWFLNGMYKALPRQSFINTTEFDDYLATASTDFNHPGFKTALTTALRLWWKEIQSEHAQARQIWWPQPTAGFVVPLGDIVSVDPSYFPTSNYPATTAHAAATVFAQFRYPDEYLMALIQNKGNGDWYYVWNTVDRDMAFSSLRMGGFV